MTTCPAERPENSAVSLSDAARGISKRPLIIQNAKIVEVLFHRPDSAPNPATDTDSTVLLQISDLYLGSPRSKTPSKTEGDSGPGRPPYCASGKGFVFRS
jgi:hypothetical protein